MIESELEKLRALSPRDFEVFIAKLLPNLEYNDIKLTNLTSDEGYDISARKEGKFVLIECKKYSAHNKVGSRDVRIFADTCRRKNAFKGVFITTGYFTRNVLYEQKARNFEIDFWNGEELILQMKNTKEVPAYCVSCEKTLNGYYSEFKVLRNEIVPKHGRQCLLCENKVPCAGCTKIIDKRYSYQYQTNKFICSRCKIRKKRKSIISAISITLSGLLLLISWTIAESRLSAVLIGIAVLISLIPIQKKKF